MRKTTITGMVVFVTNVGLFLLTVPFFLNEVHHHWIIPVFAAWLLFQTIVFVSIDPKWGQPASRAIMGLSVLMGVLLFWRQFSMFHCFRHCEGRLTVGLLLLAGANGIAWRYGPFNRSRWLWGATLVFLVWAIIVMAIGMAFNTWNFS